MTSYEGIAQGRVNNSCIRTNPKIDWDMVIAKVRQVKVVISHFGMH